MIAGILAPGGAGGHFFDWTLHYLAGHDSHLVYHIDDTSQKIDERLASVPHDPIQGLTAHGHVSTHLNMNRQNMPTVLAKLRSKLQDQLHTFFFIDPMGDGIDHTCYSTAIADYPDVKFFTFGFDDLAVDHLFYLQITKMHPDFIKDIVADADTRVLPIWEQRELTALYYPYCVRNQTNTGCLDAYCNHYQIAWCEFLRQFDVIVPAVLDWLEIKLQQNRWYHWSCIYERWKQSLALDFFQTLPQILHCIRHNIDYDLSRFGMDIGQEIVIESLLLRHYNLSLKSFGFEKMPTNSKDWHTLLEPNIYHQIP